MVHVRNSPIILQELKEYIIPLSKAEFDLLTKDIVDNGCRDAIVLWDRGKEFSPIIVDGHNRFKICQKHSISFRTKRVSFGSLDDAKLWMVANQMGRRNLNPDQLSYYRGVQYHFMKKDKGGMDKVVSKGKGNISTSELLANQFNVSTSTIKRDAKYAEGIDIIGAGNSKLRSDILTGKVKVNKADIQVLTEAKNKSQLLIKNAADLHNKAKTIKNEMLDDIERNVKLLKLEKTETARNILKELEPVFLSREQRIQNIKALIVSAMNRTIREKNSASFDALKRLIDRLQYELFD